MGLENLIHEPSIWIGKAIKLSPWRPVIDGKYTAKPFVKEDPELTLESRSYRRVPAILGIATEEANSQIAPFINHPGLLANFSSNLPTLLFGVRSEEKTERDKDISELVKRLEGNY